MDYKESLNLPQTDFPMKANLPQQEPEWLRLWDEEKLYHQIIAKNKKRPRFIFHDGPPYANGHIHYGTILNKVLKDIVVKFRNMKGFLCEFIPGWDCHGLPIELQVDKILGPKKKTMTAVEIRQKCRDYANSFLDIQRKEFKQLGCLARWEKPYVTMSPQYEATIAREFANFLERGYLYRGKRPVYWCASCRTALAEAEVEYADHQSPSIYVKFRLLNDAKYRKKWGLQKEPIHFVIWTTTPWTIPANLAISLHPDFTYAVVKIKNEIWIVADGLLDKVLATFDNPEHQVLSKVSAKEFERLECQHPLVLEKKSLIVLGSHVTLEAGTGCVHIAPGHGQEDYIIGKEYGLDPFSPLDDAGRFVKEVGLSWLVGKKTDEANEMVIEHLNKVGALAHREEVKHSYPHCWRCNKPIIFRATEQWFISMDHKDLRKKSLKTIDQVEWIPSWGRNRIYSMVQYRPDWCVSRQRSWGVPIIAILCGNCGESSSTPAFIRQIADRFEKSPGGADVWFDLPLEKLLPKGYACPKCGEKKKLSKEKDILDVWFDSGVSSMAVLENEEKLGLPADLYLEGSDQHRGWFHTSLLAALGTREKSPYKQVLTHGFVVDAEGKKLSKSAQNYIPPEKVLQNFGAEMLRFWTASEDYRSDIRFSEEILSRLADAYRKVRNTCRYILGNLYDFNPEKDIVDYDKLLELDHWALARLNQLTKKIGEAYEKYEFHQIVHLLIRFSAVDLSAFYFDILKDRLYTESKTGLSRRSAQTVLFYLLDHLARLMAPILSFTAEEVWSFAPSFPGKPKSIFLSDFPQENPKWEDPALLDRWDRFFAMRACVTKALELARKDKYVRNSLEAKIILDVTPDQKVFLESFGEGLSDLFIVSHVEFGKAVGNVVHSCEEVAGLTVAVDKAPGSKCERCWKYSESVGSNSQHPGLCQRCQRVVK